MEIEDIYRALQENLSDGSRVTLLDVASHRCTHRHLLRLRGVKPIVQDSAETILLREAERRMANTVAFYFRSTFGKRFKPGMITIHRGVVESELFGVLDDDTLVEVVFASKKEVYEGPNKNQVSAAAALAHFNGLSKAWVLMIDRNALEWQSFLLTTSTEYGFAPIGELIDEEIRYLAAHKNGDTNIGLSSLNNCRLCPFFGDAHESCTATLSGQPDDPPTEKYVVVQRLPTLTRQLDTYLETSRKEDTKRMKPRISPSHFSTTECDLAIAYGLMGKKWKDQASPNLLRVFDMGHAFHGVLQDTLEWVLSDFKPEIELRHAELPFEGHADGMYGKTIIEIKTISEAGFEDLTGPKPDHRKQATLYLRMAGATEMVFIYINKGTGSLKLFRVEEDRELWHSMAARATRIDKAVKAYRSGGSLPPKLKGKDYICKACRFAWDCRPELLKDRSFRK